MASRSDHCDKAGYLNTDGDGSYRLRRETRTVGKSRSLRKLRLKRNTWVTKGKGL